MKEFNRGYHWSWLFLTDYDDDDDMYIWQIDGSAVKRIFTLSPALFEQDVYVILVADIINDGTNIYHMHIWIGAKASELDVTEAERYAASLDVRLRRRTTLHWERQDRECDQFLGYFQPAVFYLPGKYRYILRSKNNTTELPESEKKMLFAVHPHGNNKLKVIQVKCDMSSLNKHDPLILVDIEGVYVLTRGEWDPKILTLIGKELSFRFTIYDNATTGFLPVFLLDKNTQTVLWDEFYKALGWEDLNSFPSIPDGVEEVHDNPGKPQLYEVLRNRRGRIYYKDIRFPVYKSVLDSKSLYIINKGKDDICLWIGKKNQDRNKAKLYGLTKLREFTSRQLPPSKWYPWRHMSIVPEGLETSSFKEHFQSWIE